jgi:hypothetical protein
MNSSPPSRRNRRFYFEKNVPRLGEGAELGVIRCGYCRSYLAPIVFSCGTNLEILYLLCPHGHVESRVSLGVIEAVKTGNSDV